MKSFINKISAIILTLILISGIIPCYAAENEQEGYKKKYADYDSYVLLGDSVASGWSDVVEKETRFVRVEGSYGAHVADDLGVTYYPMACVGFRTTEMRYIFEDDFEGDRFLFYSIDDEEMEWRIPLIREAVSQAGLITLNVGGNDWGSFLGWHIYEEMDKFEDKNEEFMLQAKTYLENAGTDESTVNSLIDLAAMCGALPDIIKVLPTALKTGFDNYLTNWNYMIEDIYELNPDVTLLVIGMFDNMVQDQDTADKNEAALLKISLSQTIVDYANKPMIEGAEKYGYIFIDTAGTVCEQNHPSAEGHRYIADKILEALPDMNFPYTDVDRNSAEYKAIEYMYQTGVMDGISDTEFAPEEILTKGQLNSIINKITGESNSIDDTESPAGKFALAKAVITISKVDGFNFNRYIKSVILALNIIFDSSDITRAETAVIFKKAINY